MNDNNSTEVVDVMTLFDIHMQDWMYQHKPAQKGSYDSTVTTKELIEQFRRHTGQEPDLHQVNTYMQTKGYTTVWTSDGIAWSYFH